MYSLGTYVGLPLTALLLLALIAGLVAAKRWRPDSFDEVFKPWAIGGLVAAIVATVVGFAAFWWPFDMDYHRWHERKGAVESVEKRLLGGGDRGMSEVFVVKFADDPTLYRCDDTRCALASKGKEIRLLCKPVWEYAAVDGWACKYGQES